MKKLMSLLKAIMSQDMNMFKYRAKTNSSRRQKILFPIILAIIVMLAIGTYAQMFAEELKPFNLTYVVLTLFIIFTTVITFIEGIYKTQGILFDSKDSDLLFSLPIKKSTIFFTRIFKLLVFQYLYNLLFMLPAFVVYAYHENPSASFYIVSIIATLLFPIIPTIVASIIGYVIKAVSVKFKAKKVIQALLTAIIFLGIFYFSFNLQNIIGNLINNASNVNDILTSIYYPAKLYIQLIQNFNIIDLLMLLAINIIPLILFIYIASIKYFKIVSKSKETSAKSRKVKKIKVISQKGKISSLVSKELKRYFSSTVYMFNTSFGLILMLVVTIAACINFDGLMGTILKGEETLISMEQIKDLLPKIFFELVVYTGFMTSITSSSISLEGKSFNILKSMPVETKKILLAKVTASNIISIPIILLCDVIFFVAFKIPVIDIIYILLVSIIVPTLTAIIGLLVNLKHPKMNAASDTEVIKQSMSSIISVMIGMVAGLITIILMVIFYGKIDMFLTIELSVLVIITIALWIVLKKYGQKRFKQMSI